MKIAVYPGTFDPVTYGHIHIAERACQLYDKVIIALAGENYKNDLFTMEERMIMLKESVKHLENVEVESFVGLTADYAAIKGAKALIRGLRAVSDFEYEMQMAAMNRYLNENLETVFLMAEGKYSFLSSSNIKQVALIGGSVHGLVPPIVEEYLKKKYQELNYK
ncbi:MAG: pantetheine-phosphate adenylyltransferase [Clostridia bacterium]|jgi:pantetheine-phosphate adenylyltransferase|nr:pantetheine-phosphate adenylyltransferase [Clostridia bacterium]